jgi:hypothetical protein
MESRGTAPGVLADTAVAGASELVEALEGSRLAASEAPQAVRTARDTTAKALIDAIISVFERGWRQDIGPGTRCCLQSSAMRPPAGVAR